MTERSKTLPLSLTGVKRFFFCGIAGVGMRGLAVLARARGHWVKGSDRSLDRGEMPSLLQKFQSLGIEIVPQNGSGIEKSLDGVIVSTAVESDIPDVVKAKELGIPIYHRSVFLESIFAEGPTIAVTGTSGKSTVTAMIAHILHQVGRNPTLINGADILHPPSGVKAILPNVWAGRTDCCVIEADESDGSCVRFQPQFSVITTLSQDHMPLPELVRIFSQVIQNSQEGVIATSALQPHLSLSPQELAKITWISPDTTRALGNWWIDSFEIKENRWIASIQSTKWKAKEPILCELHIPGYHNLYNAMVAIATCSALGIDPFQSTQALLSFSGLARRLELIAYFPKVNIRIYDDFAHNPEKVASSLATLHHIASNRILIFFQLHGFAPTKLMFNDLVSVLSASLSPQDILFLPEIYFAGGTVNRDISAADLAKAISSRSVHFYPSPITALQQMLEEVRPGDTLVVMGARDPKLPEYARYLQNEIAKQWDSSIT